MVRKAVLSRTRRILGQLEAFHPAAAPEVAARIGQAQNLLAPDEEALGVLTAASGAPILVTDIGIHFPVPAGWTSVRYDSVLSVAVPPKTTAPHSSLSLRVRGTGAVSLPEMELDDAFQFARFMDRAKTDALRRPVAVPHIPIRAWTHPSVRDLSPDPVVWVITEARRIVFDAIERGWHGPPFDPFELARMQRVAIEPSPAVAEARLIPGEPPRIEYNPDRPAARQRYSVAHELAHVLFPDFSQMVRYRHGLRARTDDWQVEILCDLAAAEMLMPVGTLGEERFDALSIDLVDSLRRKYAVSLDAALLRAIRMTSVASAGFGATPTADGLRIDYWIPSVSWQERLPTGFLLPAFGAFQEVRGIGFTAKQTELLPGLGRTYLELIGAPPVKGTSVPRVVGLAQPANPEEVSGSRSITYLRGDALDPRGSGARVVVFVVNDKASTWGGGFARQVREKWPGVQATFKEWARAGNLRLGNAVQIEAAPQLWVFPIVAQHHYRQQVRPGIRYAALESGLAGLGDAAALLGATVHMPRIGAGQARGNWSVISGLISEQLIVRGVPVTVYDLPGADVSIFNAVAEPSSKS